jgi:branched-chain amino acid transport system permease protein
MKKLPLIVGLIAAAILLFAPPFLKNYGIYLLSYWLVFIIAAMGLNLTVGYAGQKSLGHASFFGIGAYTVALLLKAGVSFWLGLPAAAIICFVVGIILGFPALRVQTIYLAFATLGFNTAIWLVMRNEEWLTGGTYGINNVARPSFFGLSLESNLSYYYLVLAATVVMGLLLLGLLRSPWGKACAGIAGGLLASLVQFIEPAQFTVGASIMMYLMVVVGGPGYFLGPVLGAAVGVILPEWLRFAQAWYLFVFGAAVVLLMIWLPDGLLSIPDRIRAKKQAKEASAARAAAAKNMGAQA